MKLGLRIKASDLGEPPKDFMDKHAYGHLWREIDQTVTVYHNNDYPSHLLIPVTRGNRIGTFVSGGIMPPLDH